MSGFEDYAGDTRAIEIEIERKGIILGIDWANVAQVHALAREALAQHGQAATPRYDYTGMAKAELFGLAQLMLHTMEESALVGVESHGGTAWKAFARALYHEQEMLGLRPRTRRSDEPG